MVSHETVLTIYDNPKDHRAATKESKKLRPVTL